MAVHCDLSRWDEFAVYADHIVAVGWLGKSSAFTTGPTPEPVYQRLQLFARNPWQPFVAMGYHQCELCQYDGEKQGTANLYIPFVGKIFVAPELITHYINAHFYQPPAVFCEAVMACPEMGSMDYKRLLIGCNGQVLWQTPDG